MLPTPERLQVWLSSQAEFSDATVTGVRQYPGGASNLTCHVALSGWRAPAVVLRLQRERGIFEPYDVLREARVHRALDGSGIPVPRVLAEEADAAHLGAPFVLLEWVDGLHLGEAGPEGDFGQFVAIVAAIHRLDWRALGLGFLGVPADAAWATLSEIESVARRMHAFGCGGDALLVEALGRLRGCVPGDGGVSLCQGDINVFNYLFRKGRLLSVVDWEQAHLGDFRSDIGQLVALSHLKGAPWSDPAAMPFVRAYAAAAGSEPVGLEYFRAFWLLQLGVIHAGWTALNGTAPWYGRPELDLMLRRALDELPQPGG